MSTKKKIEQEVEKTLRCFDQPQKLADNPFFYTRVKARIEKRSRQTDSNLWQFGWKILKPAFLVLIVVLNIFTITNYFTADQSKTSERDQLLKTFAQEFALDQSNYNPSFLINE